MNSFTWFERLLQNLRVSVRMMRKAPGFTAVVVLTLTFAIGANVVVFSILNALVLRPLDVPHPESLYTIEHSINKSLSLSYLDYIDIHERNRSFIDLAAYSDFQVGLDSGGNPSPAFVDAVTGNYFDVLGIKRYLGRFFHASDEH